MPHVSFFTDMDVMISYILQSQLFMSMCVCVCVCVYKMTKLQKYHKKNYLHYLHNCAKNVINYQHPLL